MHTKPLPRGAPAICNQVSGSSTQRSSRDIWQILWTSYVDIQTQHHVDLFPSSRHNLQCSMKPREPDSSLKLPFYCQFIPFFSYTERQISNNWLQKYIFLLYVFGFTGDVLKGRLPPPPPSLVTRSTKLKNPSEQPPKKQGAGGRKEQFLKIDCSIGRDQHTWVFCCDR